jgi:hypothetical protein
MPVVFVSRPGRPTLVVIDAPLFILGGQAY